MKISPERILRVLLGIAVFLGMMHLLTRYLLLRDVGGESLQAVFALFNMNHEVSIPTWYSQMLLIIAGAVAGIIGLVRRQQGKKYAHHWLSIAFILAFMSLDEGSQVHELATQPLQAMFDTQFSLLHYAWILAAGVLVLVVVLIFFRFWLKQPTSTRLLLLAAAVTYVVGAIGFEVLGGYVQQNVSLGMKRALVNMLEETCEMIGAILAIYAFLTFLRRVSPANTIELVKRGG